MNLNRFSSGDFDRGASRLTEALWFALSGVVFSSWLPGSGWRRSLLRLFGAEVGKKVVLKPRLRVKFPWRLKIGDYSWIGENVWIDNLAPVTIGSHACLSQGAYLCTGSHDWTRDSFDLITRSIEVQDHAWVGAQAVLAPGAILAEGAVLSMASLGQGITEPWTIYAGQPAKVIKVRPRVEVVD